jgi:transposase
MTAREKTPVPKSEVQEVASDEPGVRSFVVRSEERLEYERGQRLRAMTAVRQELAALAARIKQGQLKAAAKIGAAAERIISRHHGHRYYDWQYDQDGFRFFEPPVNLQREEALEGKYLIRTEEQALSPVKAVSIYKELSEVERAFANLKDIIELRPIDHRTDERVQAHIFVAALAFLLHRMIEQKLKAAGVELSATEALQALRSVKVVDFTLADGQSKRCVTRGSERAARVLRALGITELAPPTPSSGEKTVM